MWIYLSHRWIDPLLHTFIYTFQKGSLRQRLSPFTHQFPRCGTKSDWGGDLVALTAECKWDASQLVRRNVSSISSTVVALLTHLVSCSGFTPARMSMFGLVVVGMNYLHRKRKVKLTCLPPHSLIGLWITLVGIPMRVWCQLVLVSREEQKWRFELEGMSLQDEKLSQ